MKKVLTTALAVMATLSIYAQGTVNFMNLNPAYQKVKLEATPGAATVDLPVAGYQLALFWAPAGTTDVSQFQQVGASASLIAAGYFNAGTRTIPAPFTGGVNASFLVRGWETAYGASYDAVVASGNASAHAGQSAIFTVKTGNPLNIPADTPTSIGPAFPGMTLSVVPEPSTIALGLLGLASLFVIRRRN